MRVVYLVRVILCVMLSIMAVSSGLAEENGGHRFGALRWVRDSVDKFCMPASGMIALIGRSADTSVLVLDSRTGQELQRFRGLDVNCTPDGIFCATMEGRSVHDTSSRIRLYDVRTGRLIWERKEKGYVLGLSARLQRCVVHVQTVDSAWYEIRDLMTGEAIRTFGDIVSALFIDEWHRRIYAGTWSWGGRTGSRVVELDAISGADINDWTSAPIGQMCRLSDSDTLLIMSGQRMQAVNTVTGTVDDAMTFLTERDHQDDCMYMSWGYPEWIVDAEHGRTAILRFPYKPSMESNPEPYFVIRRFNRHLGTSECFMREKFPADLIREYRPSEEYRVNAVDNSLYALSSIGPTSKFICMDIEALVGVVETDEQRRLAIRNHDSHLRIDWPADEEGEMTVIITDVAGRLVEQRVIRMEEGQILVPVSGLVPGVYLCAARSGKRTLSGTFVVTP